MEQYECNRCAIASLTLFCLLFAFESQPALRGQTYILTDRQTDSQTDGTLDKYVSMPRKKDRCLIFYHVPKSGGVTLHNIFRDSGLRLWTNYGLLNVSKKLPLSDRENGVAFWEADVYMGHWTPYIKEVWRSTYGFDRNCYEATMLREPMARILSAYFQNNEYDRVTNGSGLLPLLQNPGPSDIPHYFDHQCRQFGKPGVYYDMKQIVSMMSLQDLLSSPPCDLDSAKKIICSLDIVVRFPNISLLLGELSKIFGNIVTKQDIQHLNGKSKGLKVHMLAEDLQRALKNASTLDAALFSWLGSTVGNRTHC